MSSLEFLQLDLNFRGKALLSVSHSEGKHVIRMFFPTELSSQEPSDLLEFFQKVLNIHSFNYEVIAASGKKKCIQFNWIHTSSRELVLKKITIPCLCNQTGISEAFGMFPSANKIVFGDLFIIGCDKNIHRVTISVLKQCNSVGKHLELSKILHSGVKLKNMIQSFMSGGYKVADLCEISVSSPSQLALREGSVSKTCRLFKELQNIGRLLDMLQCIMSAENEEAIQIDLLQLAIGYSVAEISRLAEILWNAENILKMTEHIAKHLEIRFQNRMQSILPFVIELLSFQNYLKH